MMIGKKIMEDWCSDTLKHREYLTYGPMNVETTTAEEYTAIASVAGCTLYKCDLITPFLFMSFSQLEVICVREDGNLWILMLKVVIVNCPACVLHKIR